MKKGDLVFVFTAGRHGGGNAFGIYDGDYAMNNYRMYRLALLEPLPDGGFDYITVRADRVQEAVWTFLGPMKIE